MKTKTERRVQDMEFLLEGISPFPKYTLEDYSIDVNVIRYMKFFKRH